MSKMCSGCGNIVTMPLWKYTYRCAECGWVMDRDENSAVNIFARYLAGLVMEQLAGYFTQLGPHTVIPCDVWAFSPPSKRVQVHAYV
jgi:transposase